MNHQYPARSQAQQPSECYSGTSAAYDTSSMVPALAQPVPYSTFTSAEPPAWVDPAHLDNTATPPSAQLAFYLTDSPQSSNSSPHPSYWPDHKYGFVFNSARPDLHPGFRHDVVNPRDLISTGASEQHRYLESRPSTYSSAGPPLHYGYYPEEPSHLQGPSPYTLDGHHPLYSPYPQSTLASQPLQQPQPQAAWPLTKVLESSREAPRLSTPQPPEKAKSSRSSSTMEESPVKLEAGPLEAAPNSPSTADSAKDSASPSGAARDPEDAALETSVCTLCEPARHFTRRSNLIAHQATHYREITKTYICNWPRCPWSFPRAADLHRHRRSIHHKSLNFQCEYCDAVFPRKDSCKRHERRSCPNFAKTEIRPRPKRPGKQKAEDGSKGSSADEGMSEEGETSPPTSSTNIPSPTAASPGVQARASRAQQRRGRRRKSYDHAVHTFPSAEEA